MGYRVSELASLLGLPFRGDGNQQVARVSNWEEADRFSVIFRETDAKAGTLPELGPPGCIIATPELVPPDWNAILSNQPKLDFARAAHLLSPRVTGQGLRHPTAIISPGATLAPDVDIGPYASIGAGTRIGKGAILGAGVIVGEGCVLGQECILYPRVVLYDAVQLGDRVIVHSGAVLGSDGFGYVSDGGMQVKFPQVGKLVIEDDVEVGANTTIDRGSLGTTWIGAGTKIDNLVQIAHNVQIGRGVVIAAQTGISGSTVIEDCVIIGGQVGFGDHARVQKGAVIGSKAGVLPGKIVRGGEVYWGVPVRPLREFKRLNALFGRLPQMKADIDSLKSALEQLNRAFQRMQGGAR
jgi:UDP-3-O-[3-hydroxymyristoyl] glucosamine N-acyltransferase